jgi:hypothetical protein
MTDKIKIYGLGKFNTYGETIEWKINDIYPTSDKLYVYVKISFDNSINDNDIIKEAKELYKKINDIKNPTSLIYRTMIINGEELKKTITHLNNTISNNKLERLVFNIDSLSNIIIPEKNRLYIILIF